MAEYRDLEVHDATTKALIDFMWGVWGGSLDDGIMELCAQDMQSTAVGPSLWHRFLQDSPKAIGAKYRAFIAACTLGPVDSAPELLAVAGTSELTVADQEELQAVQALLMTLRRKTVTFAALPSVGGASGADFSKAQLEQLWEGMRLGHRFGRNKTDVRAFAFAAELDPPNVGKQVGLAILSDQVPVDTDRVKRVLEFIVQKRTKDYIILLFDGRSRPYRRVMEQFDDKLAASGAHAVTECWLAYVFPTKTEDPRVPGRQTSFVSNNKEVLIIVMPTKGTTKVVQRAEFNSCGESSTSFTTYTGVPARRFSELPRMDADSKGSILGVAAAGAVKGETRADRHG